MTEGCSQNAEGNVGLIQINELNDSYVFQVVNNIQAPEDVDGAISSIQTHIEELQLRKGWRDARIPLLLGATVTISLAIFRWDLYSLMLGALGGGFIYAGRLNDKFVTRINTEITAANSVLVECYKHKVSRKFARP